MTHRGLASLGFAVWAAALVLSASASHAQSYKQCQEEADGNTMGLKDCDAAEVERRETMLNRLYKQVLHAAGFRMSVEAGGTDAPLVYNACRLELIARRIDDLQRELKVAQLLR